MLFSPGAAGTSSMWRSEGGILLPAGVAVLRWPWRARIAWTRSDSWRRLTRLVSGQQAVEFNKYMHLICSVLSLIHKTRV